MIEIQTTLEKYEELHIEDNKKILNTLKKLYPKEYAETIESYHTFINDMEMFEGNEPKTYTDEEVIDIIGAEDIIVMIDDFHKDNIITNYFVIRNNGFEKLITNNGYQITGVCSA